MSVTARLSELRADFISFHDDGNEDLAVTNLDDRSLSTLMGLSDGTFATGGTTGTLSGINLGTQSSSSSPTGAALDFDGVNGTYTGGSPTISGSNGDGIRVANSGANFTFSSVSINGTTDAGIELSSVSGTFAVNGGTIGNTDDPAGNGIDINAGFNTVTIAASITKTTANAVVDIVSVTWGKQTESATEFRCIAGTFVVHVGLKGKLVKLAK